MIVDTSVWSLALRRRTAEAPEAAALAALLRDDDARLLGVVRQELLTGIRETARFEVLRNTLRKWPDHPVITGHFELAAEAANTCRSHGIQGSNVDYLICAVAMRDGASIFTTDADFERYAVHLPITLFEPT